MKPFVLVSGGALLGVVMSLSFYALADRSAIERSLTNEALPITELRTFAEVFGHIKQGYVEPVEDRTLIKEAINGMLTGLDPHSAYLDAEAFKELREGTQGEFGGLGIEIGSEDGFIRVIAPIEDTPAFRAGLKSGDLIVKLDGVSIRGLSTTEAVKRMRGKPGTKITLTISRKNENRLFNVQITRAIIKVKSVRSKLIEPDIGYIRISQFQEQTLRNLVESLNSLQKQNRQALKGLVLDLRDDPGGLLSAAVGVSAVFLPKNSLVVYTEGRAPDAKMYLEAKPEHYLNAMERDPLTQLSMNMEQLPIVVLVNAGSASASEIVAGALQDHDRAKIIGEKTFGKGSVQTILPLGDQGGIKLTTARYFTPKGRSIQAKGIDPDWLIELPVEAPKFTKPSSAIHVREADLEHHLSGGAQDKAKEHAKESAKEPAKENLPTLEETVHPRDPNPAKDRQLSAALDVLKGKPIPSKAEQEKAIQAEKYPNTPEIDEVKKADADKK